MRYAFRTDWSPEDQQYVARVAEFPSLSFLADAPQVALTGLVALVEQTVADLQETGQPVPEPFADRSYSGKFLVRVSPSLHRRLSIEAAENGVSLNAYVAEKLAR